MKSNKQLLKFIEKSLSCIQSGEWKAQDIASVFMIVHYSDTGSHIDFKTVTAVQFFSDLRENVFKFITNYEKGKVSDEYKERFWFHVMNLLVKNGSVEILDLTNYNDGVSHYIGYIYISWDELDCRNNNEYITDIIKNTVKLNDE